MTTSSSVLSSVLGTLNFLPRSALSDSVVVTDLRQSSQGGAAVAVEVQVADARDNPQLGLQASGFELVHAPSKVKDFYDCSVVMTTYYEECRTLAKKLTGAHTTFTFDHVIREPDTQYNGGGTDGSVQKSGPQNGGGYVGSVHMDYTDRTLWNAYLALHGEVVPSAKHVYALNFWRPLSESVDDNPLAVCDARTVDRDDLLEVDFYGYGAKNYSWHNIGIETFSVSTSNNHRWYYYPGMTPDDVLVIKSYDSAGVVGTTCPHASFAHPHPQGIARRSIELRVLCFC